VAVVDLRKHEPLWEDFYDALLVESCADESRENLESVRQQLTRESSRSSS
jgi:hypothetical protein